MSSSPLRSVALIASLVGLCNPLANGQEDRDAVERAQEDKEVQQGTHPLLRLEGPYASTWESLATHRTPQWFLDAKVGFSMHWGPYAVPAWATKNAGIGPDSYSEWYMNRLRTEGSATQRHHEATYGQDFAYDDFIPMFTAENFSAGEWMRMLSQNGVKYFFITAKHHDGFCLWGTDYTNRNSVKMGPKRDILDELVNAARSEGIKIGFYYSLYEWYNPLYIREFHGQGWLGDREAQLKAIEGIEYTGLIEHESYVDDFMIPQVVELIDRFHPDFLCFDGEWDYPESYWRGKQIAAYYYNQAAERGQEVVLNDRLGKGTRGKRGDFYHVEYYADIDRSLPWAMWRGLGKSFGHNRNEDPAAFLTPEQAVRMVVDCVATNGNIEFNVGPTSDGRIDQPELSLVQHMGAWLRANGDAIYGAEASPLPDLRSGRATHKPDKQTLYLHVYDWPSDGQVILPGVTNEIESAHLLTEPDVPLVTKKVEESLVTISGPKHAADPFVSVIAVKYTGRLHVAPYVAASRADSTGAFCLDAHDSRLTDNGIRFEEMTNAIGYWTNKDDYPTWRVETDAKVAYELTLNLAAPEASDGMAYAIMVDGVEAATGSVKATGGWREFRDRAVGVITIGEGKHDISVRKLDRSEPLMNLRYVRLKPVSR